MDATAKQIADRMKRAAKVRTYGELGEILDGITSQAISGAIAKDKIPAHWFDIIEERYGVTREELCRSPQQSHQTNTAKQSPFSTLINVNRSESVEVNNQGTQAGGTLTMEVTPREQALILRMRDFAPEALWRKIEAELDDQENKYR